MKYLRYLYYFTVQEALSCIFPVSIFFLLAISKVIHIPFLYRYDFIFIACIFVQVMLVRFKLETMDEVKMSLIFHVIGLLLELYKTHIGSWSYPEYAIFKIEGVPLYSGFMYSSIASYVCHAWRRFDLEFINWPSNYLTYPLSFLIYGNFYTNHYIKDFRWYITALMFIIFSKSIVKFKVNKRYFKMPVSISFLLIGFFIWVAENISTYLGAWKYPNQMNKWHLVHLSKISSWFLLVIISVILVANIKLSNKNSNENNVKLDLDNSRVI